jgi:hypothetical protein
MTIEKRQHPLPRILRGCRIAIAVKTVLLSYDEEKACEAYQHEPIRTSKGRWPVL